MRRQKKNTQVSQFEDKFLLIFGTSFFIHVYNQCFILFSFIRFSHFIIIIIISA